MFKEIIGKIKDSFRKSSEEPEPLTLESSPLVSDEGQVKVGVIEYFEAMRKLYAKWLGKNGFSYFITGKEQEFLSQVDSCDAVILDDRQPDIKGFLLSIKLKTEHPELPTVICTADASLESHEEYKTSRADALLIKPLSEEEVVDCLRRVMVKVVPEPVAEEKKPAKRGRKPFTFVEISEKRIMEFQESGLSKTEFARRKKISLSLLKNEFKIASSLPEQAKKIVKENIDCFKKSMFEYITKLKDEQSIVDICNEIAEQGKKGIYYDLIRLKGRIKVYLELEEKQELVDRHSILSKEAGEDA